MLRAEIKVQRVPAKILFWRVKQFDDFFFVSRPPIFGEKNLQIHHDCLKISKLLCEILRDKKDKRTRIHDAYSIPFSMVIPFEYMKGFCPIVYDVETTPKDVADIGVGEKNKGRTPIPR